MEWISGFAVTWVEATGSTNADLLAAARQGAPSRSVISADHQHSGRGRRGRSWEAAPGSSLLFSVLIRPTVAANHVHLVTTALSLGAAEACETVTGVRPGLKWPNDLVVADRKLAGVLAESVAGGDRVEAVVVGMGLNVSAGAAPPEMADTAVTLEEVGGAAVDRRELLAAILARFSRWLEGIDEPEGRQRLLAAVRRASATLGRPVSVELGDGRVLQGRAEELDETGGLVLDGGRRVVVGDVIHLRPRGGGD